MPMSITLHLCYLVLFHSKAWGLGIQLSTYHLYVIVLDSLVNQQAYASINSLKEY